MCKGKDWQARSHVNIIEWNNVAVTADICLCVATLKKDIQLGVVVVYKANISISSNRNKLGAWYSFRIAVLVVAIVYFQLWNLWPLETRNPSLLTLVLGCESTSMVLINLMIIRQRHEQTGNTCPLWISEILV